MIDIPKYQKDFSLNSQIMLDYEKRIPKIDKVINVLKDAGVLSKKKGKLVIDIGCSGGFFISSMVPFFEHVIGLDIDNYALVEAKKSNENKGVLFIAADSMLLPLPDNSVDLIICNHVYEHVPDSVKLFSEIYRVLNNDGACYYGAASRLTLFEPHYFLPFLSWLPKWIAHYYMSVTGKGDFYYEKLRTYWGIKKLIRKFNVYDYTLEIVMDPDRFSARDIIPKDGLIDKIPLVLWKAFYWLLPGYIFILRKREY
ncbi:MAG: class I SAM-dependent methyltransferase [Proteobacteria bacterium]|nr:class I SAM-dependent methyltransferase [Pseudomonadota bacterium]